MLNAEGDRQAKVLRADGDAEAIRRVFEAIHEGRATPEVLAYAYLQVLPEVADGQATKLLMVPSDALAGIAAATALGAGLQMGNGAAAGGQAAS